VFPPNHVRMPSRLNACYMPCLSHCFQIMVRNTDRKALPHYAVFLNFLIRRPCCSQHFFLNKSLMNMRVAIVVKYRKYKYVYMCTTQESNFVRAFKACNTNWKDGKVQLACSQRLREERTRLLCVLSDL
jgi:hypothetical protein